MNHKRPAASLLFRGLTTGLLSASLATGCSYVTPTVQADQPYTPDHHYVWVQIAPAPATDGPSAAPTAKPTPKPTPKPTARPRTLQRLVARPTGTSLAGNATWYRYVPGGAAAGPLLRKWLGVHWRGQHVTVCAHVCIRVTLSDWCLCSHSRRLLDLDARSFSRLTPLSSGVAAIAVYR